jgi:hypothetical protein
MARAGWLVVAACLALAAAQQGEFDDAKPAAAAPVDAEVTEAAAAAKPSAPAVDMWTVLRSNDWTYEMLTLGAIVLILALHFLGSSGNKKAAETFAGAVMPILNNNFAVSGEKGALVTDSALDYRAFCSGRRNCNGLCVQLSLKNNLDPTELIMKAVSSSGMAPAALQAAASAPTGDIVTVDIALPDNAMALFLLAVPSAVRKEVADATEGEVKLLQLGKASYPIPGLPGLDVFADAPEARGFVFDAELTDALAQLGPGKVQRVHITDMAPVTDLLGKDASVKGMRIVFELPDDKARWEATLRAVFTALLRLVDRLGEGRAPAALVASVQRNRDAFGSRLDQEAAQERTAKARADREAEVEALEAQLAEARDPRKRAELEAKLKTLRKGSKEDEMRRRMRLAKGVRGM